MLPANPLLNATAPAGPHLPTATLRQYVAGALAPAARHRVEAHTLACPRCADILEGLLQTTPATTDQALAQLQQRLRRRVQQQVPTALPATRTRHRNRWLVPQLAAAAALLFGLVAGGWWTWQQRHASQPIASQSAAVAPAALPTAAAPQEAAPAAAPVASVPAGAARPARATTASPHRPAQRPLAGAQARAAYAPQLQPAAPAATPVAKLGSGLATSDVAVNRASRVTAGYDANARRAAPAPADSAVLSERVAGVTVAARATPAAPLTLVRDRAMPAAPALPPTPQGGYPAWGEKVRREAAEFKPEAPEQPLSGSVQLRVLIGPDGKIREIRVLHGLRADYDDEAQRLVCDGPGWVPGIGGGKRAPQAVDVAVPFQ